MTKHVLALALTVGCLVLPPAALAHERTLPSGNNAPSQHSLPINSGLHGSTTGTDSSPKVKVPLGRDVVHPETRGRAPFGFSTVTGTALDLFGSPLIDAKVSWGFDDADGNWVDGAETTTAWDGRFSFSGVVETYDGQLDVYYPDSDDAYQSWSNLFSASQVNDITLRPGVMPFATTRTGESGWDDWEAAGVETWGSRGGGTTYLPEYGDALVMPPDADRAVVYYYANQAVEVSGGVVPVVAGARTQASISVDQDQAQRIWILRPAWHSGKPGSTIRLALQGWPYGWTADFYGYSQYPSTAPVEEWYETFESEGDPDGYWFPLAIPGNATPGYAYQVHAYRSDDSYSQLDLHTHYQVCTLKSSRSVVAAGQSIRLRGVIPTEGHEGRTPGKAKSVILYQRTRAAGQPAAWDATRNGWHRVGTLRANGLGAYRTRLLRPTQTTWYVVRYPGDDWYWGAFTSVLKVRVRSPQPIAAPTIWVGITETGECYHRLNCRYYTQDPAGNQRVTLRYAKAQGFRPCKVCRPPQ